MLLENSKQYKIEIELPYTLENTIQIDCENILIDNLNYLDHLKCHTVNRVITIIFNPSSKIDDKFIFQTIENILYTAGISFVRAVIKQYVGNLIRTATASLTGGVVGAKSGIGGLFVGLIAGAVVEKMLFDWKSVCSCTHDQCGNLQIRRDDGESI